MHACLPRFAPVPIWLALLLSATPIGGCGDDGGSPPSPDGGGGHDGATHHDGGGDGGGGDGDGGATDNGVRYDETFDQSCASPAACDATQTESACTCVTTPRTEDGFATNRVGCGELMVSGGAQRTPEDDFCVSSGADSPADLSCFMPGSYREQGEVQMVTLYGVVDVFGNGGDADNIAVEVYEEGVEGALGTSVGTATAVVDAEAENPCFETEDQIDNDMVVGTRRLGFYQIPDVPTETPLIVKTSGDARFWKPIYSYNVQVLNGDVKTDEPLDACTGFPTGPRANYRARILSSSDWDTIPNSAGLPDGVQSGNGVVAGEVHDCADVRLEFAQVATNPQPAVLAYFNDNPDNPLPQLARAFDGTSRLGLYAALDVPAGPVHVGALGRAGGELVSLGWYRVQVFDGAVTAVTLRGLRPHQTGM